MERTLISVPIFWLLSWLCCCLPGWIETKIDHTSLIIPVLKETVGTPPLKSVSLFLH